MQVYPSLNYRFTAEIKKNNNSFPLGECRLQKRGGNIISTCQSPSDTCSTHWNTVANHLGCWKIATNSLCLYHLIFPTHIRICPVLPSVWLQYRQTTSSWHKSPDTAVVNTCPDVIIMQMAEKPRPLTRR